MRNLENLSSYLDNKYKMINGDDDNSLFNNVSSNQHSSSNNEVVNQTNFQKKNFETIYDHLKNNTSIKKKKGIVHNLANSYAFCDDKDFIKEIPNEVSMKKNGHEVVMNLFNKDASSSCDDSFISKKQGGNVNSEMNEYITTNCNGALSILKMNEDCHHGGKITIESNENLINALDEKKFKEENGEIRMWDDFKNPFLYSKDMINNKLNDTMNVNENYSRGGYKKLFNTVKHQDTIKTFGNAKERNNFK